MQLFNFGFTRIMPILTNTQEHALLQSLRGGDERAFEYFFHRFFPLILLFVKRFIADDEVAEEVVQDVFYKVWKKQADFEHVQAMKAFLYIAARNTALKQLCKAQNRSKYQGIYAAASEQIDQPAIDEIIRSEVFSSLSEAISTLPAQCQRIIRLIFEEDQKPVEIAEKLNISISTVNSQKARGLSLLKERLTGKDWDMLIVFIVSVYWSK